MREFQGDLFGCRHVYSAAFDQPWPRRCLKCGEPEKPKDNDDICKNRHGGEPFSEMANPSADQKRRDRYRIYVHIANNGPRISEEIERELHMRRSTASARMSELKRDGFIKQVGRRTTTTGATAGVYDIAK